MNKTDEIDMLKLNLAQTTTLIREYVHIHEFLNF